MVVLVEGQSSTILDLEVRLVQHYSPNPLLVNRAAGGTGLARGHPKAHLYACVGGDSTRLAITRTTMGS